MWLLTTMLLVQFQPGEPIKANVAQLVRALDCESKGYGFNSRYSPYDYLAGMVERQTR